MGCLPLARTNSKRFDVIGRQMDADHLAIGGVMSLLRAGNRCGHIEPEISLDIVLRDALTVGVKQPKNPLCRDISLFGCLAIPDCGLRRVSRAALGAIAKEVGQPHLPGDGILFGCLAKPVLSLFAVALHSIGLQVVFAHCNLRRHIAAVSLC